MRFLRRIRPQYDHPRSALLALSRVVPVPFTSTYGFEPGGPERERATWWQWRDHIWRHRRTTVVPAA